MNRDPNRAARPDGGGERHAVSVTRMCLRSGSVQLPFALSGRLPQGELLVHEAEAGEPMVLWSEPPRTLAGLGPLFERHEIQVNDQLVLELAGDDLRLSIRKRPRRSRPQVTPSTWSSHRAPDGPLPEEGVSMPHRDPEAEPGPRGGAFGRAAGGERAPGDADDAVWDDSYLPVDDAGGPREGVGGGIDGSDDLDDAPRAPRVRVSPLPRNEASTPRRAGGDPGAKGEGPQRAARPRSSGGVLGDAWRTAKGWFGRPGGARRGASEAGPADESEDDWVHAWDDEPAARGAAGDAASPRVDDAFRPRPPSASESAQGDEDWSGAGSWRATGEWDEGEGDDAPEPEAPRVPRGFAGGDDDEAWLDTGEEDEDDGRAWSARATAHGDEDEEGGDGGGGSFADPDDDGASSRPRPEPSGTETGAAPFADGDDETVDVGDDQVASERDRPAGGRLAPEAAPSDERGEEEPADDDEASAREAVRRAAAWRPDRGVPSRAERFLAGDLRTRLLRFLTSPDMPLIAKTELIASRFDLPAEVARDMLEDIADDPPRGFRLTPVREGAWRIERTGT